MADKSFLDWPFFEPRHKELALKLDDWAKRELKNVDHGDTDGACRDLVTMMGQDGWLRRSGAEGDEVLDVRFRGCRYSFGYPACPDLEDRATLVSLLEPERIGVELSEELQLHPEQSTDALVVHHPEAKYFKV